MSTFCNIFGLESSPFFIIQEINSNSTEHMSTFCNIFGLESSPFFIIKHWHCLKEDSFVISPPFPPPPHHHIIFFDSSFEPPLNIPHSVKLLTIWRAFSSSKKIQLISK